MPVVVTTDAHRPDPPRPKSSAPQAVERRYEGVFRDAVQSLTDLSRLRAPALLRALRHEASIPLQRVETAERRVVVRSSFAALSATPLTRRQTTLASTAAQEEDCARRRSARRGPGHRRTLPPGIAGVSGRGTG